MRGKEGCGALGAEARASWGPGCCRGPATAAARWRLRGARRGRLARGEEVQRAGGCGSRGQGVTRGAAAKLELACGRPRAAASGALRGGRGSR